MNRTFKLGIYEDEEKFVSSVRALQEKGISIYDVFMPYPVHEIFHLLKRKSKLPTAAYFLGLFAIIGLLAFLYYTSVLDWPIDYGGKPFNSFPSFVVVTIVLTIFTVTIGSLALFSARSRMIPGRENTIFYDRATDDRFVIVVEIQSAENTEAQLAVDILKEQGAVEILDKQFEKIIA